MGYNIRDVGGETAPSVGGFGDWTATLDLSLSGATTISGDFNVVPLFGAPGEATDGYVFSALSDPTLGTLVWDAADGTYTFTVDWAAVIATGSDQVISFVVTGTSGTSSDSDTVTIDLLICVVRGTCIETPRGPMAVEDLRCGDLILVLDGAPQPIRWIGSRAVSQDELTADPSLRPVRFRVGALGQDLPKRDLRVSPQHRVYLQDWRAQLLFGENQVLVTAKSLINDFSICVERFKSDVEYFHILFDDHQIMFTEGVATESFHPGAYTMRGLAGPTRQELLTLFPQLSVENGYGSVARPTLKSWETRVLMNDPYPEKPS